MRLLHGILQTMKVLTRGRTDHFSYNVIRHGPPPVAQFESETCIITLTITLAVNVDLQP